MIRSFGRTVTAATSPSRILSLAGVSIWTFSTTLGYRFVEQLTVLFGPEAGTVIEVMVRDWREERWTTPDVWPPSQRFDLFGSPELQKPAWEVINRERFNN